MTDSVAHGPTRKRRTRLVLFCLGTAILLAGGAVATGVLLAPQPPAQAVARDLDGNFVALDPGEQQISSAAQDAVEDGGGHFRVPAVGLDVPLGALNEVDGEITPPGFTSVYWVRNRGVEVDHAAEGTVFIVTHSLRGGGVAPGNYLIDIEHGRSALAPGTSIYVDDVEYLVDSTAPIGKGDLADQGDIWDNTPNRLVLITCLQVPDGTASVDNMVIIATRRA